MTAEEEKTIRMEIARLRLEHRDLDSAIDAMSTSGKYGPLQMQRLKKKKLAIKDHITRLEDSLFPDIIA